MLQSGQIEGQKLFQGRDPESIVSDPKLKKKISHRVLIETIDKR